MDLRVRLQPARLPFVLLLALVGSIAVASGRPTSADEWKAHEVRFADSASVGGTMLSAGVYRVTHSVEGQSHVMIFTGANGATARVRCAMVPRTSKAARSVQGYEYIHGVRTLRTLIFKGDWFIHEF